MPTLRIRSKANSPENDEPVKTFSLASATASDLADDSRPSSPDSPRTQPPGQRETRRRWPLLLIAALLVVSAVAVTGWVRAESAADDLRSADSLRTSAAKAARTYAVDLTTYSYGTLDDQQARLAAESTDRFQSTFADSMKSLKPIFVDLKASAKGAVLDAAVKSASDSAAVVLVFVDQSASSSKTEKPQTQASRLRVHLVREGDTWLLDEVELM